MRLFLGFAAKNRSFGKAIRRIQASFDSLCAEFMLKELANPIHDALLVGVTDDLPDSECRQIKNNDGVFQVLCGFKSTTALGPENDEALKGLVFRKIEVAVEACPFTTQDKIALRELLAGWASRNLSARQGEA